MAVSGSLLTSQQCCYTVPMIANCPILDRLRIAFWAGYKGALDIVVERRAWPNPQIESTGHNAASRGSSHVTASGISQETEPYPVHQRRFLIDLRIPQPATVTSEAIVACRRWQHEYLGGVYVSLPDAAPGRPAPDNPAPDDLVRRFAAEGCDPTLVIFYRPSAVAGLSTLVELTRRVGAQPCRRVRVDPDWTAVATVLGSGATDLVGTVPEVTVAVRIIATAVNRILGDAELPLPVGVPARRLAAAALTGRVTAAPPTRAATVEPRLLLTEGALRMGLEFEQRVDSLRAAADAPAAARAGW